MPFPDPGLQSKPPLGAVRDPESRSCRAVYAATPDDLVRAYPEALSGFDGTNLIWRDGTRMPIGQVQPGRSEAEVLRHPSIADQLAARYPPARRCWCRRTIPARARNEAFFDKMYGTAAPGRSLPSWCGSCGCRRVGGTRFSITSVNGVDRALTDISRELDALPEADKKYLQPLGGTYNCRSVAGTGQTSMHSWGAAIDINPAYSDYWRWKPGYTNRIPAEIVAVSSGMASFGAAAGRMTTRCISSIGRNCLVRPPTRGSLDRNNHFGGPPCRPGNPPAGI